MNETEEFGETDEGRYPLHALVCRALDDEGTLGPRATAAAVLRRIPDGDLRAALAVALPGYARHVIDRRRIAPIPAQDEQPDTEDSSGSDTRRKSWKVRGWQAHGRMLSEQVWAGKSADDWIPFGDCLRTDVQFLVADRRRAAASTLAWSDWYRQADDLMELHAAPYVRDLPPEVLTELAKSRPKSSERSMQKS